MRRGARHPRRPGGRRLRWCGGGARSRGKRGGAARYRKGDARESQPRRTDAREPSARRLPEIRSALMTVDVHTHVWEYPCHLGEHFIADAKAVSGDVYKDISVDLDRHWEA